MSSITFADHKLGGRIVAACDAIAEGHLNRAAGILAELADELNVEATEAGLLSEQIDEAKEVAVALEEVEAVQAAPQLATSAQPVDLQMCSRGVHSYGASDSNGWRHCQTCGVVNVSPPENSGAIDMSIRQ